MANLMEELTWDACRDRMELWRPDVEEHLAITAKYIGLYRTQNDNGEQLSQILAELNYRVMHLGDFQAKFRRLALWSDKRYEFEKAMAALKLLKQKNPATYAKEAKYETLAPYLDIMVNADAMHMRVQNGRSSARDTTEAIRSRISQIKGALRSS